MNNTDQDVKAAKAALKIVIDLLPHTRELVPGAIEDLIDAKMARTVAKLSERIEQKLGVVILTPPPSGEM
jgi:NAD(P)H-dependent FMN reductase